MDPPFTQSRVDTRDDTNRLSPIVPSSRRYGAGWKPYPTVADFPTCPERRKSLPPSSLRPDQRSPHRNAPKLPIIRRRESPLLARRHQPCLHRIHLHIVDDPFQL